MATGLKPAVRSQWQGAILVCAKCSKRAKGGFGPKGDKKLAKLMRRRLGVGKGRKSRFGIVEVKCLGLCPKNAVTIVDTSRPDHWFVVPVGSEIDVVLDALQVT